MSDTERVRAWRQRLKDNGLVPMTIWVKAETKARYEDLALQSHHSASELAQLALDAYRLDSALVSSTATDTEQIRAIVTDTARETLRSRYRTRDGNSNTAGAQPAQHCRGVCIRYVYGLRFVHMPPGTAQNIRLHVGICVSMSCTSI